jgi:hypothetical protein
MPVILTTPDEVEIWMTALPDEALKLQRPLPDGTLRIVAKGVRKIREERPRSKCASLRFHREPLTTASVRRRAIRSNGRIGSPINHSGATKCRRSTRLPCRHAKAQGILTI